MQYVSHHGASQSLEVANCQSNSIEKLRMVSNEGSRGIGDDQRLLQHS